MFAFRKIYSYDRGIATLILPFLSVRAPGPLNNHGKVSGASLYPFPPYMNLNLNPIALRTPQHQAACVAAVTGFEACSGRGEERPVTFLAVGNDLRSTTGHAKQNVEQRRCRRSFGIAAQLPERAAILRACLARGFLDGRADWAGRAASS